MATTSLSKRKSIKTEGSLVKDRLSGLPCDVLCRILSQLSTKESVSTSILSRRWKDLWSQVPALDLGYGDFKDTDFDLMGFIDCFLEPDLALDSFKLVYDVDIEHCHESFVSTIDEVVERGVSHLTILNMVDVDDALVRMPLSLYSCSTLVDLTLYAVVFDHPQSELVSLPRVKTMYLEGVKFDGHAVLKNLISSCPVLEDLTVITHPEDYMEVVCVRSQSLKNFTLKSQRDPEEEEQDPNVVIDAPRLEYMSVCDYRPERFVIRNVGPNAKVNVDVMFDDIDLDDPLEVKKIRKFLFGISKFHEVTISAGTLEFIHEYSQVGKLPKFLNLTRLDASLVKSSWEYLPAFLGCCTNLHSLILELDRIPEIEEIQFSPVPQCVLSSLHSLQLKTPQTGEKIGASVRKDHIKKFEAELEPGTWKVISTFGLNLCTGYLRPSLIKYKISTRYGTTIFPSDNVSDDHYLSFTSFDSILAGNLDKNLLLVSSGGLEEITSRNNITMKKIEFEIRDTEDKRLSCTLWETYAEALDRAINESSDGMVMCFLRFVKQNSFKEKRYIENAFNSSILMINPQLPEMEAFQNILPADQLALTITNSGGKRVYNPSGSKNGLDFPLQMIADVLAETEVGKCRIACTISAINTDWGWFYISCRKCNKKVDKEDLTIKLEDVKKPSKPRWRCETCNEWATLIEPKYKLHVHVWDKSGETKIFLFDSWA
ncbi:PREDICTED: FBD-associated F-box protein At1g60410-like isoform X2 [Camelina sativa]|uniref:FBD-associated F-box protein At1g60410-like isoform X2 n=1 Tax=Camelina sativa TaxID=90675 RepID=A0ABM1QRX8_CAMSA|nr:PREDICTED: FBD-associated F-box protein At1g60410-like isoform X2 [Camelina sativa]